MVRIHIHLKKNRKQLLLLRLKDVKIKTKINKYEKKNYLVLNLIEKKFSSCFLNFPIESVFKNTSLDLVKRPPSKIFKYDYLDFFVNFKLN